MKNLFAEHLLRLAEGTANSHDITDELWRLIKIALKKKNIWRQLPAALGLRPLVRDEMINAWEAVKGELVNRAYLYIFYDRFFWFYDQYEAGGDVERLVLNNIHQFLTEMQGDVDRIGRNTYNNLISGVEYAVSSGLVGLHH